MGKFGFGSKKDKGSSAPQSDNPYAQAPNAADPYADTQKYVTPYQQARNGLPSGPRAGGGPMSRNGSIASTATAPPPYNQAPSGYSNDRYGASSGYGDNKYAGGSTHGSSSSASRGPGGYGGLGPSDNSRQGSQTPPSFPSRYSQNQTPVDTGSGSTYAQPSSSAGYGQSDADSNKYGGYGEQRELTEEEKEDQEYRKVKAQIHETTQASLQTNQDSLRYMNQAIDTGLSTYAQLGAQNERLHHTDQLLDTATESHRHAEAQTKKLKSLNRSMFAVHVKNPFTEKRRTAEQEARILSQNQADREIREASRRDKFAQNSRMEQNFAGFDQDEAPSSFTRVNRGDRSKYTLEDDSDEEGAAALDQANEQIERDLEQMSLGVGKLKRIGQAMGDELDHSNKLIDRIGSKTDPLDDQIRVTNARMNRIK
ncbi:hypothetical protein F5Y18DRAFT_383926 [Xylariaceae sp. FL1019]|nr:hypothetical protein F5Y18DRAFT_383926 [Xylariaceae sp. FL1019]